MADLTHLNDGSVLANLRDRYARWLIYVSEHFFQFSRPSFPVFVIF